MRWGKSCARVNLLPDCLSQGKPSSYKALLDLNVLKSFKEAKTKTNKYQQLVLSFENMST